MNNINHEDYPFNKDLDEDLDIFLGNYGIDLWEIWSEVINDYELNKEKQN